jgi:hypothetical protein
MVIVTTEHVFFILRGVNDNHKNKGAIENVSIREERRYTLRTKYLGGT